MRRAIRWACDEQRLTPDSIKYLPPAVRKPFEEYALTIAEDMQYNQLKYFRPFEHQLKFFATGAHERRGILAANRIGKTVSTVIETAIHLTGQYPAWWPKTAKRWDKPVTVMVAGEGWQQVALVLQAELLGTPDIKLTEMIGSGAIPRENIL